MIDPKPSILPSTEQLLNKVEVMEFNFKKQIKELRETQDALQSEIIFLTEKHDRWRSVLNRIKGIIISYFEEDKEHSKRQ